MADQPNPHPTDLYVGTRIRLRRRTLKVSQEKLAERLGLTFQQVQKYERGANRVSASKLQEIACALDTPVSFFFEGLPSTGRNAPDQQQDSETLSRFLASSDNLELVALLSQLTPRVLRHVLGLVRALAPVGPERSSVS